jgi:hypothetical protein
VTDVDIALRGAHPAVLDSAPRLLVFLLALSLTALLSAETPGSPAPAPTSQPVLATLERSESGLVCGSSDVITIAADGTVRHDSGGTPCGRPRKSPTIKEKLTQQELAALMAAFDKADFFKMKEDTCGPGLDHATILSISHTRGGQTKTVTCRDLGYPPRALIDLESQINRIVSTRHP